MYDPISVRGSFIAFPGAVATTTQSGGFYYDYAVSRWLPVHRNAVSPDGLRYAFTEGWSPGPARAPRLHIADAATGKDLRIVTMPDAMPYNIADFAADGIFVIIAYEGIAPGVWRVDPNNGAIVKTSDGFYVPAGPTWISVVDPIDPNPARSAMSGEAQPNRIDYRDAAGQTTTWFYRPGHAVVWVAFAGKSQLLVQAYPGPSAVDASSEYWMVTGPGEATMLTSSNAYFDLDQGFHSAISDAHGVWVGGYNGLYLVTPGGAITRAYSAGAFPANGCF